MRKILALLLVIVMVMSLAACSGSEGKNSGSSNNSDSSNNSGSGTEKEDKDSNTSTDKTDNGSGEKTETDTPSGGSGPIIKVASDLYAPVSGSQAEKYWHVKDIQNVTEFDGDGKCTVRDTVYYLNSASDYDDASAALEGWEATWSSDKTYFSIDRSFKDYTTVEDAIEESEDDFLGYTLTYSNGGTEYVAPPTDERKTEIMKEMFGFSIDDVKSAYEDGEYIIRKKKKVSVTYKSEATVDDINALAKIVYDLCVPVADDGKIYTYMGKYGDELTEAPVTEDIFWSAKFNYFKDGKEIAVEVQILNSGDFQNTLDLLIQFV